MTKETETGYIWVRSDYQLMPISFESIMYIEAKSAYTLVHTFHEKILSNTPLRQLLYQLPSRLFFHSHSSYVVAVSQIKAIELTRMTLINDEKVPLTRSAREPLIDMLKEIGAIEKGF